MLENWTAALVMMLLSHCVFCAVSRCRMDCVILSRPSGNMAETFLMPNLENKYKATKQHQLG